MNIPNVTTSWYDYIFPSGEDRWLCTLLLKRGWRVAYSAAADAYTFAPEKFEEFYKQVPISPAQQQV